MGQVPKGRQAESQRQSTVPQHLCHSASIRGAWTVLDKVRRRIRSIQEPSRDEDRDGVGDKAATKFRDS